MEGIGGGVTAEQLRLDLSYKSYTPAEMMAYLPGIVRVDAHTVRFQSSSTRDISRFLEFATSHRADLTP